MASRLIIGKFKTIRGLSPRHIINRGKTGFFPGGLHYATYYKTAKAISPEVVNSLGITGMSNRDIKTLFFGFRQRHATRIPGFYSNIQVPDLGQKSTFQYYDKLNKNIVHNFSKLSYVDVPKSQFGSPRSGAYLLSNLNSKVRTTFKVKDQKNIRKNIVEFFYRQRDIDRFAEYSFQYAWSNEQAWVNTLSQLHVSVLRSYERGVSRRPTGLNRNSWQEHATSTISKRLGVVGQEKDFKPADIKSMGFSPLRPPAQAAHIMKRFTQEGRELKPLYGRKSMAAGTKKSAYYQLPLLHQYGNLHSTLINNCHRAINLNVLKDNSFFQLVMNYEDAPYALFHEFGTKNMPQRDFIRAGYRYTADELKRKINKVNKGLTTGFMEDWSGDTINLRASNSKVPTPVVSPTHYTRGTTVLGLPGHAPIGLLGSGAMGTSGKVGRARIPPATSLGSTKIPNSDVAHIMKQISVPGGYVPVQGMGRRFGSTWKNLETERQSTVSSVLPIHKFSLAKTQWLFAILPPINVYKYYGMGVSLYRSLDASLIHFKNLFYYGRAMLLGKTGHSPKIYRRAIRGKLYGGGG